MLREPIGLLDYFISPALCAVLLSDAASTLIGCAVKVPLRGRTTTGYIAEEIDNTAPLPDFELKTIVTADDDAPELLPKMVALIKFTGDYYGVHYGEVLDATLPLESRRQSERLILTDTGLAAITSGQKLGKVEALLLNFAQGVGRISGKQNEPLPMASFSCRQAQQQTALNGKQVRAVVPRLKGKGWLQVVTKSTGPRRVRVFRRLLGVRRESIPLNKRALTDLWDLLDDNEWRSVADLNMVKGDLYGKLKSLLTLSVIESTFLAQRIRPQLEPQWGEEVRHPLTDSQQKVVALLSSKLSAKEFFPTLLEGVTGSGKTEVYLHLIEQALAENKTALILVPEIALTPQLGARFRARFGDQVATFHSGLTPAERRDEWQRVASGEAVIGLGARSAIFLPLDNIGVIVVDEEHETSFKQEESPRYNARDLAIFRAKQHNAIIILGSATPSLESRFNADKGRYHHALLPHRVADRPMPTVTTINMSEVECIADGLISEPLWTAIEETISKNQQVILFLNRRGFAPYVFCKDCGHNFRCDDCEVSLTFHRGKAQLQCHYCGFFAITPEQCPNCDGLSLQASGVGTERVEQELQARLPNVKVDRLDRDTVHKRTDIDKILSRFRKGESKILLGTQMVTKGHDFPQVTLVGVLNADSSLNFPDFRAAERTFQLLTQVAGRAGRGELPGRVLVQTYQPEHYAVMCAKTHDYNAFLSLELQCRKDLDYPPFSHLLLLRFSGAHEQHTKNYAQQTAHSLNALIARQGFENVSLLGPAPAPLSRLKGLWRFQLLIKSADRRSLQILVAALRVHMQQRKSQRVDSGDLHFAIDIDPIDML